jgi:putative DNA primase/helicase
MQKDHNDSIPSTDSNGTGPPPLSGPTQRSGIALVAAGTADLPTQKLAPIQQIGPIDTTKPLAPESFPNPPRQGGLNVPTTIPNVRHLLRSYGITVRYNVIKKKMFTWLPQYSGAPDNIDNVALTHILSLANLNRMSTGLVPAFVDVVADENLWNPVADWIQSRAWDGVDRLAAIFDTLQVHADFDEGLKRRIMYCWLLSCVAAALMPTGFACRGVLTIQGQQGLGKTRWIRSLVPDPALRDEVVRLGHHLDAGNKDDVITAVSHWIVEIGELDSSFRKDVAALKGFLTNDRDKLRRPYGRVNSEYPRRTVFAATVNDEHFLVDSTGNTRFWTLPATAIDFAHGIDMQQLFAQLRVDFLKGQQWWLSDAEQVQLEALNRTHRAVSAIHDRVPSALDLSRRNDPGLPSLTAIELLGRIGIRFPSNGQCKECYAALRELLGEPKRIKGQNRWRVPLEDEFSPVVTPHVDDNDLF